MRCRAISVLATLLLTLPLAAFGADGYWFYSFHGIDVTAYGDKQYAKKLAHNLHRLDQALQTTLRFTKSDWRPYTTVYAVPDSEFTRLMGVRTQYSSVDYPGTFANTILINTGAPETDRYAGAYFGWTSSLLTGAGSVRYPFWFDKGISEVFSASQVSGDNVKIGAYQQGRVDSLFSLGAIPLQRVFRVQDDDPQMKSSDFDIKFSSECWFLVHQFMIEGQMSANFNQFLTLLDRNEPVDSAFMQSFGISYAQLDEWFHKRMNTQTIRELVVKVPDEADPGIARLLSDAEAKARLAVFAAEHASKDDYALSLAQAALAADPANPDALTAMTLIKLRQDDYDAAFQSAEKLCNADTLSAPSIDQCSTIYSRFASATAQKQTALPSDGAAIAQRSKAMYERAIAANSNDLAAWAGEAQLLADWKLTDDAKKFLPQAEQTLYLHPSSGELAQGLMRVCTVTGDYDDAFKFAVAWQKNALTDQSRDAATEQVSSLKAFLERRRVQSGGKSQQGQ